MSLQTGQTSSLAPEIYQTFFNEGIDKENKNTHILIITVKVAPSVMMGCDGIKRFEHRTYESATLIPKEEDDPGKFITT